MSSTFPPRLSGASAAVPAGLTLSPQAPRSPGCCHQPQTGRWGGAVGLQPPVPPSPLVCEERVGSPSYLATASLEGRHKIGRHKTGKHRFCITNRS